MAVLLAELVKKRQKNLMQNMDLNEKVEYYKILLSYIEMVEDITFSDILVEKNKFPRYKTPVFLEM